MSGCRTLATWLYLSVVVVLLDEDYFSGHAAFIERMTEKYASFVRTEEMFR